MTVRNFLKFDNVYFTYETASDQLLSAINMHAPTGWTGVVGPNGTGKTTILLLAGGLLDPDQGKITRPSVAWYCPQRTDFPPEGAETFLAARDRDAQRLKLLLQLKDDWLQRWPTLSHGERKRVQIATALYKNPDLLAIDEPSNHLDSSARDMLMEALSTYKGVGLLVSHDRQMLDLLCRQCVFIEPPVVKTWPGNYSEACAQRGIEELDLKRRRSEAEVEASRLQREYAGRKHKASRSDSRNTKRKLSRKDSDSREKIDRARVTGQDGARGRLLRQMSGRMKSAQKKLENTPFKKENVSGINILGEVYPGKFLLALAEGKISLGGERDLSHPLLNLRPQERVSLTGPNGSGKSTLFQLVLNSLAVPEQRVTCIPQELDKEGSKKLLDMMRRLPKDQIGWVMNMVSRLGSSPERLLASEAPSPGEARKLLLALGLLHEPWLVMMDEPTNHMDLPSIECLESALADCRCALLLVSHDRFFLDRLTSVRWNISKMDIGESSYTLDVS